MNENTQNGMNMQQNPQPMPTPQPTSPTVAQPMPANPSVVPQPMQANPVVAPQMPTPQPVTPPQPVQQSVDPMSAVSNLNKEEAMEEALSHTTQYSPFQVEQQVVNEAPKKINNKKAYVFIAIIVAIMAVFILLLPYISKLFNI